MPEPAAATPNPTLAPAPAPAPAAAAATPAPVQNVVSQPAPAPAGNDPSKGVWPEDWHKRMAGEDEKELKQIARYQSPADVWKKARSLEQRLSSGEFKAALPKDPKPEEIAAWRKDNGIPEKPEAYDIKDLKIPDTDKEIVGNFLKAAHEANMTPAQAKVSLANYYKIQESQSQARAQKDDEQRHAALDQLNAEWGGSFRRNVNLIEGTILSKFPEDVRALIKSARLPDGTALFNNVSALKALAGLALELNPAGIVAPNSGGDLAKPALAEYQDLQKFMQTKRSAYNKDPVKQERMVQLIDYLRKQDLIDDHGNVVVDKKKAA